MRSLVPEGMTRAFDAVLSWEDCSGVADGWGKEAKDEGTSHMAGLTSQENYVDEPGN